MRVVRILHENEYQGVRRVFSTRDRARDGNRLAPCTDYVYVAWGRACREEAPNICQSLNAQASNTQSLLTRLRVQLSSDESLVTRLEDIHHDKRNRLHQRPKLYELSLKLREMCLMGWKICLVLQALCLRFQAQCQDVDKLCKDDHKLGPEVQVYCLDLQKRC